MGYARSLLSEYEEGIEYNGKIVDRRFIDDMEKYNDVLQHGTIERNFLLIYNFLKIFNLKELKKLHSKKLKNKYIDTISAQELSTNEDLLSEYINNIYGNIFSTINKDSITNVYGKNERAKFTKFNKVFYTYKNTEKDKLNNAENTLVIDDADIFSEFIEEYFLIKSNSKYDTYNRISVLESVVSEYFSHDMWEQSTTSYQSYYTKTSNVYRIPKSLTNSALLKRIIINQLNNENLNTSFDNFIKLLLNEKYSSDETPSIDLQKLFNKYKDDYTNETNWRNGESSDIPVRNTKIFVNHFVKILSWNLDEVLTMFKQVQRVKTNYTMPQFFNARVLKSIILQELDNDSKSFYFSGVASETMLVNSLLHIEKKFKTKKNLKFATDNNYKIDSLNAFLSYLIKTKTSQFTGIKYLNLLQDNKINDGQYDVTFTITPLLLKHYESDFLLNSDNNIHDDNLGYEEDMYGRWSFPLSKINLAHYIHFKNSLFLAKKVAYILVPTSFISTYEFYRNRKEYKDTTEEFKEDEQMEAMFNVDEEYILKDYDAYYKRNKQNDNLLYYYKIVEIIKEQNISKVIQFPKNTFPHIKQECILLVVHKNPVDGIHIGKVSVKKFNGTAIGSSGLTNILKHNQNSDLFNDKAHNYILSKWVSYVDIIDKHNYNITPNYHLTKLKSIDITHKVDDIFDVKKVQKYNYNFTEGEKADNLFVINSSDFPIFGVTTEKDIPKQLSVATFIDTDSLQRIEEDASKTYSFIRHIKNADIVDEGSLLIYEKQLENLMIEKNKILSKSGKYRTKRFDRFERMYQIKRYDILMYVHNPKIITLVDDDLEYGIATHNLLRLRVQDKFDKKEAYSKALYMFFKSKLGQQELKKIITKDKNNRDILLVPSLENIALNLSDREINEQVIKFNKFQTQYEMMYRLEKYLNHSLESNTDLVDIERTLDEAKAINIETKRVLQERARNK